MAIPAPMPFDAPVTKAILPWRGGAVRPAGRDAGVLDRAEGVRPDGSRLHGVGIRPAVAVTRTLKGLAAGRDEALDKAVELVRPPAK